VLWLPISAGDVSNPNQTPPGDVSPFGTALVCSDPD
jgi:hypothetical protein